MGTRRVHNCPRPTVASGRSRAGEAKRHKQLAGSIAPGEVAARAAQPRAAPPPPAALQPMGRDPSQGLSGTAPARGRCRPPVQDAGRHGVGAMIMRTAEEHTLRRGAGPAWHCTWTIRRTWLPMVLVPCTRNSRGTPSSCTATTAPLSRLRCTGQPASAGGGAPSGDGALPGAVLSASSALPMIALPPAAGVPDNCLQATQARHCVHLAPSAASPGSPAPVISS